MLAFKFKLEESVTGAGNPLVRVSMAVVIAENEAAARQRLLEWAEWEGYDAAWVAQAKVQRIGLASGVVLAWAQGI